MGWHSSPISAKHKFIVIKEVSSHGGNDLGNSSAEALHVVCMTLVVEDVPKSFLKTSQVIEYFDTLHLDRVGQNSLGKGCAEFALHKPGRGVWSCQPKRS